MIGLIGTGAMGGAIANRLLNVGRDISVYDADPQKLEALGERGARVASNVDQLLDCDEILLSLPSALQIRDVLSQLKDKFTSHNIVVNLSTIAPDEAKEFESMLGGTAFVDAPVARSTADALQGRLIVLASGDESALDRVDDLLHDLSEKVFRCGTVGTGSAMKLVNNLCNQAILFITAEAFLFGEAMGIERDLIFEVLCNTNADNGHLRRTFPSKVFVGDFTPGFPARLAHKDLLLAIAAANGSNVPVPASAGALQAAALTMAMGSGDQDSSAYYDVMSRLSR